MIEVAVLLSRCTSDDTIGEDLLCRFVTGGDHNHIVGVNLAMKGMNMNM